MFETDFRASKPNTIFPQTLFSLQGKKKKKKKVCLHLVDMRETTGKRVRFNNKRFINNVK